MHYLSNFLHFYIDNDHDDRYKRDVGKECLHKQTKKGIKMTKQELIHAKETLHVKGWDHVCSLVQDGGSDSNYGLQFMRGSETFWLNKDTINDLPA